MGTTRKHYVEPGNVQFVLLRVETEVGPIGGFGLCYENQQSAVSFFQDVHLYSTSPSSIDRLFGVKFSSNTSTNQAKLEIDIIVEDATERHIVIEKIPANDVEQLLASFKPCKYYFMLAGFKDDDNSFIPIPPEEYHFFKADLIVDGVHYVGARDGRWPKSNPFTKS